MADRLLAAEPPVGRRRIKQSQKKHRLAKSLCFDTSRAILWTFVSLSRSGKEIAVVVGGKVSVRAAEGIGDVVLGNMGLAVAFE